MTSKPSSQPSPVALATDPVSPQAIGPVGVPDTGNETPAAGGSIVKPMPQRPPRAVPEPVAPARPPVGQAKVKFRHRLLFLSFVVLVLAPIIAAAVYLWTVAEDQFASTVGFSVRREEGGGALDVLGGLAGLTQTSSSSDTDILYEYLSSQKLVADMDAKLDLRAMWSKPADDPYFSFDTDGSIEDLVEYWQSMVQTSYDSASGLIEVKVLAFDPADATRIATALLEESSTMINALSAAAREDTVRFSREELEKAEANLRTAREAVTIFRVENQIVDPTTDFQTQAGLVATLESQLASAQIELDLLGDMSENDPRNQQARRRIEVIEARIAAERAKVGAEGAGGRDLAALAAEYERLAVEREFAERVYLGARAAYDLALAESQRTSRYLAAHIMPTTAEVSRYPERLTLLGVFSLLLVLFWSISALIVYSLKDRR